MLSLLLTAAIACPDVPAALCPPCHPEDAPLTFGGFLLSVLKSLVSLAVIVFPLYKTFKAWESNRLKACRAMLAYWSAITLLNAMKDITDEIVGNWMNPYLHHIIVAVIKLAPLVLVHTTTHTTPHLTSPHLLFPTPPQLTSHPLLLPPSFHPPLFSACRVPMQSTTTPCVPSSSTTRARWTR